MAKTPTQGFAARRQRVDRDAVQTRLTQQYATRRSLKDSQGPYVAEVKLPSSGRKFLVRRLDLVRMANAGTWSKPMTTWVRRLMLIGNVAVIHETVDWEAHFEKAALLMREATIVPPPEFLAGDIELEGITRAMCRPLFVEADPDADQLILADSEAYEAAEDRVVEARAALAKGADTSPELTSALAALDAMCVIHWADAGAFVTELLNVGPGSLARFRPVPPDALGSLGDQEGDGPEDQ